MNVFEHFIESLCHESNIVKQIMENIKPMNLTEEEKSEFQLATKCHICEKAYMTESKMKKLYQGKKLEARIKGEILTTLLENIEVLHMIDVTYNMDGKIIKYLYFFITYEAMTLTLLLKH